MSNRKLRQRKEVKPPEELVGPVQEVNVPNSENSVVETLNDYGVFLKNNGRIVTAVAALKRAIAIQPDRPEPWQNLGAAWLRGLEPEKAKWAFLRAVELNPDYFHNYSNLGLCSCYLKQYGAAEKYFDMAEKLVGDNREYQLTLQWQRAIMHLERGQWDKGFPLYEARIAIRGQPLYPVFSQSERWEGAEEHPLDGKSLYISPEQGIGDRLLLARFFKVIKDRWPTCRLITCMGPEYWDLFWDLREIVEFMPSGVPWPGGIDYYTYQGSLPLLLGIKSPADVPPDSGHFLRRVASQQNLGTFNCPEPHLGGLKVGIAWTGNPNQDKNHERSIPLESFLELTEDPRITLYSFQVGPEAVRIEELGAGQLIYNWNNEFSRHGMVAAGTAMMDMDLVITCCTATAHLAGVLGVPCWTLLCHAPYWVWLQDSPEAKERTVWYPNMRIFRQRTMGDWKPVFEDVKRELETLLQQSDFKASVNKEILTYG